MLEELLVIGNGMAGVRAVEAILARDGGTRFKITVFGEEQCGHYDRTLLPQLLRDPAALDGCLRDREAWYAQHGVELRAGVSVTHISRHARSVSDSTGRTFRYDKLVIATGSGAYVPPVRDILGLTDGLRPGVFTFRNLEDARAVARAAKPGQRVAVVGGGVIGIDVASGLREVGCQVHLVELSAWLLNRQLNSGASAILQKRLEDSGIELHLGKATDAILGSDRVTGIAFRDGSALDCDLVVIAAGAVPNTWLAFQCGLSVERGLVVDNHMRSIDDACVYAVGECAQHRGKLYGVPAVLDEQCKVLADHITATNPQASFLGSKEMTQLCVVGIELTSMGEPNVDRLRDEVLLHSEPYTDKYQRLVIRNGRLVSAILLGKCGKLEELSEAFQCGSVLPHQRLSLLADAG